MYIFNKLKNYISSGDTRSVQAKKNIILSFGNKFVAILISLAIIPATIDYLDSEQYGIWLTLSSIVAWLSFFDVGLGHGFRNRFAEAKAHGNIELARKYVSTTYFTLIIIFSIVLVVFEIINPFLNWAGILNISQDLNPLLSGVVSIILIGVCLSFVANVAVIMLSADQKPALSAMIATVGQGLALLIIYILKLLPNHNMRFIAFALSLAPVAVTLIASFWLFTHKYREYAPSFRQIDKSLIKDITNLGIKFFVIQVSMILIFQIINIVLSREIGPSSVTEYNVAYKYFSIPQMIFNIITAPFWSAYTDAFTKGDYDWMKRCAKKLQTIYISLVILSLLLLCLFPHILHIWLHGTVNISISVATSVMVYICSISVTQLYIVLLNGIGKVFLQMMVYVVFAIICFPITIYLCRNSGIIGVMSFYSFIYIVQAVLARKQLNFILNKKAHGIWDK